MISTEIPIVNTDAPVKDPPSTTPVPSPTKTPARPFPAPSTNPTPHTHPDRDPDDDYPTCTLRDGGTLDSSCWEDEFMS